ncbi:hypothetical protein PsYK624_126660 [Phanerochaete sordida]|uniref:Uncharacterized protein n=1 Tax=Phanerochaete sordida TaxID=48140 RepID=A0A9P3GN61_9APHY|nr:hypothetical protein PsYK624_126660 [Phanerochaete sordida]
MAPRAPSSSASPLRSQASLRRAGPRNLARTRQARRISPSSTPCSTSRPRIAGTPASHGAARTPYTSPPSAGTS